LGPDDDDDDDYHDTKYNGIHPPPPPQVLKTMMPLVVGPLCLSSLVYTCIYAGIYARENYYGPDDWQRCLVMPNKVSGWWWWWWWW